jgi:hypothetical protein
MPLHGLVQKKAEASPAQTSVPIAGPKATAQKQAVRQNGLPALLEAGIEQLSGLQMDNVEVRYGSSRSAQIQALAFAQGNQIHLGPQQGRHLPHEAWHVVQQKSIVPGTKQMKGGLAVNDDPGLEAEANQMGAMAVGYRIHTVPFAPRALKASYANEGSLIQGKFAGSLGSVMKVLTPARLNVADNYYAMLWKQLAEHEAVIHVEQGGPTYDQATSTIRLSPHMLEQLMKDSALPPEKQMPPEQKAFWISLITHEFSHAHDHLIQNRHVRTPVLAGVEAHTRDVIDTELRAWAREALSAHQLSPNKLDENNAKLVNGWLSIEPAMLGDLASYKSKNYVVERLFDYISRELAKKVNDNDRLVPTQEWTNNNMDWLVDRVGVLKNGVVNNMKKK